MDKEMFLTLYKRLVRPHLEYGSSVYGWWYQKKGSKSAKTHKDVSKTVIIEHQQPKLQKPSDTHVYFDGILPFVKQLGLRHIRARLYFLPLSMLHDLYESTLTLHFADVAPPEHRLQGIILDISSNRLFKAARVCDYTEKKNRPFLKYEKKLLLICMHHFDSDVINNMDHVRISGT